MSATNTFSITGERVPADTQVVGFRGREAISRPYRVEVFALLPAASLAGFDPRGLLGRRATLKVHRASGEVRRAIHGAWSTVTLVRSLPGGAALFRCALAPMLWRLSLTRRSRVFVGETLPRTVEKLLREAGLTERDFAFELASHDRYTAREHVCQYRETNLDFVSRQLEHEGLYYYFTHANDGASERLVITDSISFARPYDRAPVRFLATDTPGGTIEGVRALACDYSDVPTGARTYGYNALTPGVPIFGESLEGAGGVVSSWEPARDPNESARLARIRAEELRAAQSVVDAQGRTFTACAGYTVTLEDHPIVAGEHLVTEASFQGCDYTAHRELSAALGLGTEVFETSFKAIPGRVQYRPPRVTERPRVQGFELGLVKGPTSDSAYAQLDAHGRYLVQLMFDDDRTKPTPSARLRMLQPHGGPGGMGFHFPLRNGTEVLVSFVGGDPDAPVIAGVAPNAEKPSPVTDANATKNVVQTGGGTRLEIEDTQGAEAVDWSTPYRNTKFHMGRQPGARPYEIMHATEGSGQVNVGTDWDVDVGGNQSEFVRGRVWEVYGGEAPARQGATPPTEARHTMVNGAQSTIVQGMAFDRYQDCHRTVVVKDRQVTVTQNDDLTVDGSLSQTIKGDVTQNIVGKWTLVSADKDEKIASSKKENMGAEHSVTLGAKFELYAGEQLSINGGLTQEINVTGALGVNIGATLDLNAALKGEANFLGKAEVTTGVTIATMLGAAIEFAVGPQIALHAGVSIEAHQGLKLEKTDHEIESGDLSLKNCLYTIFV